MCGASRTDRHRVHTPSVVARVFGMSLGFRSWLIPLTSASRVTKTVATRFGSWQTSPGAALHRISRDISFVLVAFITSATLACAADLMTGTPSHDVTIGAVVRGRSELGDSATIRIANTGADTAFVSRCGSGPLLLVEQFVDGAWTGGVQNFACPASTEPGPIVLPPGGTIDETRFFGAGRYRITVPVGSRADLSDADLALSNEFDAP